jgi:pilus assembly protein CpaF
LTPEASGSVIASAIDFVVYITAERLPGGAIRRFISSIREVGGWDGNQVMSSEVAGPGPDGLARPCTALLPNTAEALAQVGYVHRPIGRPSR